MNMHEERESGKRIIEEIGAIDHWDAVIKLNEQLGSVWLIVKSQREALAALETDSDSQRADIGTILSSCRDIARQLALHGGDDHKSKNEALLLAVARLLTLEWHYSQKRAGMDMDDLPF